MEYKLITAEHYDPVLIHLRKYFFADEPLNRAAGLCQNGGGNVELEQKSVETMQENLSLMAIDAQESSKNKGQIIGVVLNGVVHPGDTKTALEKLNESEDSNYKKIFELLYKHALQVDLFERFGVDRIFDVRILSVDGRYRGQGIAKELVRRTVHLARKDGFQLMRGDATGIFSQKILMTHGFEPFSEQLYDRYKDDAGKIILPVEAPHMKLQLLIKHLNKD